MADAAPLGAAATPAAAIRGVDPARNGAPAWTRLAPLVAGVVAAPLLAVLAAAAFPAGPVWRHLVATTLPGMLLDTALLAVLTGLIAAAFGTLTAWLVVACRFPGRGLFEVALLLPLAMPAYVCGYTYTWLLDVAGPVQTALRALTGLRFGEYWFPEIRSLPGAALMLAAVLYPYVHLLARAAFAEASVGLLDASRTLGLSQATTFRRLALPMARPAIVGGVALVLMETLADFGTVQHFAVRTFTTGIYEAWFGLGDRNAASQLAAALVGGAALLLALEAASRGGRRFHPTTGRNPPLHPQPLGRGHALLAALACLMPVAIGFLVPAGTLLWLTFEVGDPLAGRRFLPFARNSVLLAAVTAGLAVALAALLAWSARLDPSRLQRATVRLAGLGYAIPGSVIAVGTLVPLGLFDNALDRLLRAQLGVSSGLLLSGSAAALVLAYLTRFLAVALNATTAGLARLRPSLGEAARTLGLRPGAAIRRVELPLARGALLTGFLLVFVDTMKELPATLIVRPFDLDTLAVRVHQLASDERLAEASTAALAIVAAGLLPVVIILRAMRRG